MPIGDRMWRRPERSGQVNLKSVGCFKWGWRRARLTGGDAARTGWNHGRSVGESSGSPASVVSSLPRTELALSSIASQTHTSGTRRAYVDRERRHRASSAAADSRIAGVSRDRLVALGATGMRESFGGLRVAGAGGSLADQLSDHHVVHGERADAVEIDPARKAVCLPAKRLVHGALRGLRRARTGQPCRNDVTVRRERLDHSCSSKRHPAQRYSEQRRSAMEALPAPPWRCRAPRCFA